MKSFFLILSSALLICSCGPNLSLIKEGDIIFNHKFVSSDSVFYRCADEKENFTGLVLKHNNQLEVLCMCPDPCYCSIKSFVKNCDGIDVKRLKNADGILTTPILKKIYKCVSVFDSTSVDHLLSWSDSSMYQSELVWKIYQCSTGLQLGNPQSFNSIIKNDSWKSIMDHRSKNKLSDKELAITPQMIFNSTYLYPVISEN